VIVRLWRGVARQEMSDAYLAYFHETGLRDYRGTPGNLRVEVLRRPREEGVEWVILTTWDSWDAIRAFAGENPERARYYPDDSNYFDELPERVEHYELVSEESER
jgi:heme-degrading monooxygenase HmoA